jgi:transposase
MYIQYTMDQLTLPMDLAEDIPENHLVRVVNAAVNRLSDRIFAEAYPGGGRDSYHPKMLTKVIIYAYTQRIYSSRQIAKAVRENVMFMWIAGRQRPDFRTINRFRSERMKAVLEKVFTAVLQSLAEEKYVKLEQAVKKLEIQLEEKPKNKPLKKAVRLLQKDLLPRLQNTRLNKRF